MMNPRPGFAHPGFTVWFTGIPSSGKTTLARLLHESLDSMGLTPFTLDGDEVRQRLTKGLGFTKEDRDENVSRISYVAKLLNRAGATVITAAISPYAEARDKARTEIGAFVEVYVCCPLPICMQRDVKGLYAKALRGDLHNLTGLSDPYEAPLAPEITVHTDKQTPEASLDVILEGLNRLGYLPIKGDSRRHAEERVGSAVRLTDGPRWSA